MKRLLVMLSTAFSMFILTVAVVANAATQFWKVKIFEPVAQTTSKTLNVAYLVQSTDKDDTFTVELFENSTSKGTQNITHDYGDSGAFTIDLPTTGTYNYKVTVTNHGAGDEQKNSDTVQVEVVSDPDPIVNTTYINEGTTVVDATGANETGQVQADTADEGQTDNQAANTTNNDQSKSGDVLGAESFADKVRKNSRYGLIALGILAVALTALWARNRVTED